MINEVENLMKVFKSRRLTRYRRSYATYECKKNLPQLNILVNLSLHYRHSYTQHAFLSHIHLCSFAVRHHHTRNTSTRNLFLIFSKSMGSHFYDAARKILLVFSPVSISSPSATRDGFNLYLSRKII